MRKYYQIEILLAHIAPPIWRRVIIPSDMLLPDFHNLIQAVMGWTNSHLHQFIKDGTFYMPKEFGGEFWDEQKNVDYKKTKVSALLKEENDHIIYEYDFGDSWQHQIILEKKTESPPKGIKTPVCLEGDRNCPPEDVGGPWGYENFLNILSDPDHEEHESTMEWVDGKFDPEYFSVNEVNQRLKRKDFGVWGPE